MAVLGVIRREPGGIDLDRWREVIAGDPRLRRPQRREMVNPFTGERRVLEPRDTDAAVIEAGVFVVAFRVSATDEGALEVFVPDDDGRHEEAEAIARAI